MRATHTVARFKILKQDGGDLPANRESGMTEETTPKTEYHRDGTVCANGQMLGGSLHGYWEWYRKDGTLKRSGEFARGEQVGEWTTYDASGLPYKTTRVKPK